MTFLERGKSIKYEFGLIADYIRCPIFLNKNPCSPRSKEDLKFYPFAQPDKVLPIGRMGSTYP